MTGYFDPLPKSSLDMDKIMRWVSEQVGTFQQTLSLRGLFVYDNDETLILEWRESSDNWQITKDVVGTTLYANSHRLRTGPDTGDLWIWETADGGDSTAFQLFDSSAGTTLTWLKHFGAGSATTPNETVFMPAGSEKVRFHADGVNVNSEPAYLYKETVYYTSDNTFTKADYPGLRAIIVEMVGGGGAGGGADATSSTQGAGGGGGGGGAYVRSVVLASNIDTTEAVTVGEGGAGNNNADGSAGEDSVFDTISGEVRADGGAGGTTGGVATPPFIGPNGGAGGLVAGSTGDFIIPGQSGSNATLASTGTTQGGLRGAGGSSALGHGTHGTRSAGAGVTGGLYGGGGSGGINFGTNAATRAGGDGADGIVIVHIYV